MRFLDSFTGRTHGKFPSSNILSNHIPSPGVDAHAPDVTYTDPPEPSPTCANLARARQTSTDYNLGT
jgi:hypothetical protein